ncbi:PREDICTED: jacalin-related lectin 3-like [Ipomoea nil]|uniref:jacalin-related lectin 3-like n=1 Tax=Ipomoea nil TaxID=35883 RepID=UPI0009008739|nr:PREDICTED: jacalin-related lectin 3-like [Ipomoea nil]
MADGKGDTWDDNSLGQVVGILVSHTSRSTAIDSLRFLCVKDNVHQMSEEHGGGGDNSEMIMLDYPKEFLIEVHGIRNVAVGFNSTTKYTIRSLTFVTNKATYGPFGQQRSCPNDIVFGFKIAGNEPGNWIAGFYGIDYAGYIRGLGVYVRAPTISQPDDNKLGVKLEV